MGPARELGHLPHPIQHGAPDPVVREGLKLNAAAGIEAMMGLEQAAKAKGDQILELAAERELAPEAVGEAVDHFFVCCDELGSLHANS